MVDTQSRPPGTPAARGQTGTKRERQDRRELIPVLGLKEYWYPALLDKKVRNKPIGLKMLGEDLVFFRGKDGNVAALWNVCPHRGGSLMHGDCHFEGTISCPYHGWTYDGDGNVLAVLPEGPESKIPGKVKARKYPTQTLRGMVFVWMGDGEPAPIEEDLPPEFFDEKEETHILYHIEEWPVNWRPAVENAFEAHVPYVHRDAIRQFMMPMGQVGPVGVNSKVVNGRSIRSDLGSPNSSFGRLPYRIYYPALNTYWPKHRWRLMWSWLFNWAGKRRWKSEKIDTTEEWGGNLHHLPAIVRVTHGTDMHTRVNVPITEFRTREVYFHTTRPKNGFGRLYEQVHWTLFGRWSQVTNFSIQDYKAVGPQRYDTQEYLSATDMHQVKWRRLLTQARGLEQVNADQLLPTTSAEEFSRERREEFGITDDLK